MKTIDDLGFNVPEEISKYTAHSAEIAIMILNFIRSNEGMNKKEFARLVGKSSTDITRWVSGQHNFTIQTLSLIEAKTGMQIIRNLSDTNRRAYLKDKVFENLSEKEINEKLAAKNEALKTEFSALMDKYKALIKEKTKPNLVVLDSFSDFSTRLPDYFGEVKPPVQSYQVGRGTVYIDVKSKSRLLSVDRGNVIVRSPKYNLHGCNE